MGHITRVFWQKDGKEKDTYFQGAVSYDNALEVVKALQGASSADVVRVTFGRGSVFPSLDAPGRRAFAYDIEPEVYEVNLSPFKLSDEGKALTTFLAVRLMSFEQTFSLTVPAPLLALADNQEMKDAFLKNLSGGVSYLPEALWEVMRYKKRRQKEPTVKLLRK